MDIDGADIAHPPLSSDSLKAASDLGAQKADVRDSPDFALMDLDQNYRYFQQTRVAKPTIYRWPANGKPLEQQAISDVERYIGNGQWQNFQRQRLLDEKLKGWFDDSQDELTREQALALIAKMFNR